MNPSDATALRAALVGRALTEVPVTPAAVLDLGRVEANCARMLAAAWALGVGWRAHVKTHKTAELTRLQVGDGAAYDGAPAHVIVSTLAEAEGVVPLLREYRARGRSVNVLYGFPLFPSAVPRLAAVAASLGPGGLAVLVDHPDQLPLVADIAARVAALEGGQEGSSSSDPEKKEKEEKEKNLPLVFLMVDMGYGREGVAPGTPECEALVRSLLAGHFACSSSSPSPPSSSSSPEQGPSWTFHGLYCHAGHSYDARAPRDAAGLLGAEFRALGLVGRAALALAREYMYMRDTTSTPQDEEKGLGLTLTLSAGATPTATVLQHPAFFSSPPPLTSDKDKEAGEAEKEISALGTLFTQLRTPAPNGDDLQLALEAHAGVYATLDLQQLATRARPADLLSPAGLALSVLAEVASVYDKRGETLINAGTLALGREPCRHVVPRPSSSLSSAGERGEKEQEEHYTSWGVVMPWGGNLGAGSLGDPEAYPPPLDARFPDASGGWQVGRISQEHGVLVWKGPTTSSASSPSTSSSTPAPPQLHVGQRVRVWPNHACIAGAGFDHYLVVDGRRAGREDEVVDVWVRWRGW